ncbi:MAG: hypothetical protein JO283_13390 [Bradyrhizobium sp.]|nr:hypothetical protein [Bradyrhizobium sp.]
MSLEDAGRLVVVGFVALLLPWPAVAEPPRGASTIQAARLGAGYDYVIHVQNTYDYRYNPEVRADRLLLARQIVKPFCPKNQIVGEDKFKTEIFGIKPGKPDYVVYVKCLSRPRAAHAEKPA